MRKLTQEDYINKCKVVHNNKYDYSLVEYKSSREKINIICPIHGQFTQISKSHKEGKGCPKCVGRLQESIKWINDSNKIHNNKYDYNIVSHYVKSNDYIEILNKDNGLKYLQLSDHHKNGISPIKILSKSLISKFKEIHGDKYEYIIDKECIYTTDKIKLIDNYTKDEFLYIVYRHLNGMCPNKVTLNYFIKKSSEINNNKYDYSLIKFNSIKDYVNIICKEHGIFSQRVSNHLNLKDQCPKCSKNAKLDKEYLINKFKEIHFNKYDYSLIENVKSIEKIKIICKEHGVFEQIINKHLSGQGCKFCKTLSIGENYIKEYLDISKIKYIRQHGFDSCRYINRLQFDFYLPENEICIEFDGIQHFKPVKQFGGNEEFKNIKLRDDSKNKWCTENNIKLIRIKYNQISNISEILKNNLIS